MDSPRIQPPPWNDSLVARNLSSRNGARPKLIVFHDTSGSGTHNDTLYLANPGDGRPVSACFTIERDGTIYKLNPQIKLMYSWHAGRNTRWHSLRDGAVNRYSVGIEMCRAASGKLQPEWPTIQVHRAAWLSAWLCGELQLGPESITTHRQLVWDGSRSDPVRFPFEGDRGFWAQFHTHRGNGLAWHVGQTEHDNPDTITG